MEIQFWKWYPCVCVYRESDIIWHRWAYTCVHAYISVFLEMFECEMIKILVRGTVTCQSWDFLNQTQKIVESIKVC